MAGDGQRSFLVVGHLGAPNLGDEAMLAGLIASCPPNVTLLVSTENPLNNAQGLGGHQPVQRGLASELVALRDADGVILCGGTHLHDAFSNWRLFYHYGSLVRYLLVFVVARLSHRTVHLVCIGAGPIRRRPTKIIAFATLALSSTVSCRDEAGRTVLRSLTGRSDIVLGFDLAVLAQLIPATYVRPAKATSRRIGVSVSPASEGELSLEKWEKVAARVSDIVRSGDLIRLFVFAGQEPGSDREVVEYLRLRLASTTSATIEVIDRPGDVAGSCAAIVECDLMLACRFHSSVLAYICRVPQVVLPYHHKSRQFAVEIELTCDALPGVEDDAAVAIALNRALANPDEFLGRLPLAHARLRAETAVRKALV